MMKKLLLVSACALALSSCFKNDPKNQPDPNVIPAATLYYAATMQLPYNLDPFDIAFRLNTLLTECFKAGKDISQLMSGDFQTQRAALFGPNTIVQPLEPYADGIVSIRLSGKGEKDFLRTGTVEILTSGKPLIDGNVWTVRLPKSAPYTVSIKPSASEEPMPATISATSYSITNSGDNTWFVSMNELKASPSSGYQFDSSDWTGTFTIKQISNPRDQSLSGVSTSDYTVEVSAQNVTSAFLSNKIDVSTIITPLRYSPNCYVNNAMRSIIDGSLRIGLTGGAILDFATATWEYNQEEPCKPKFVLKFQNQEVDLSGETEQ